MFKVLIIFLLSISTLFAKTEAAVKVNYSTINSTSDEIVYNTDGSKLSHLYWRVDNVSLIGLEATLMPNEKIAFNISYYTNPSESTSTMDDYDWDTDNYAAGSNGYTHWSHHENTTVKDVTKFDLNAQLNIISGNLGTIYGILGYKQDSFKWESYGGFYEYSSYNFERRYISDSTKVISYNQYISAIYIGLGVVYTPTDSLKINTSLKYSNNVSIKGEDTHHLRTDTVTGSAGTYTANGIYFEDSCDDATLSEIDIALSYAFNEKFSTYINYNYVKTSIAKGSTTAYYLDTPYYSTSSDGTAGAAYEASTYTFGLKVSF